MAPSGAPRDDRAIQMRTARWLRLGCISTTSLALHVACGSSEPRRTPAGCKGSRCEDDAGDGTGGRAGGTGGKGTGGASTGGVAAGGATSGGQPASGGASTGGASSTGGADASVGDDAGTGGVFPEGGADASDGAVFACPAGTADCGGDPFDCETNIATDATNCGRCTRTCGATAACTDGLCAPTPILDPTVSSNWCGAAFSATRAYMNTCWGTSLSEIRVANLEPGADITGTRIRAYTGVPVVALRGMLIDGNDVYYGLEANPSNLWKFPLDADDTSDVTLGVAMENGMRFDAIQLVGDTYYWADNNHLAAGSVVPGSLYKRGKTDSASTELFATPGLAYDLQVTATKLTWLEVRNPGTTVNAYRMPIAGGILADVQTVGPAAAGSFMVEHGDYVYWTVKLASPNGKVLRYRPEDETITLENVATGLNLPEGLVTDATHAYFKQLDSLYRVPLAGGTPERLSIVIPANDTQATQLFHVDDRYIYLAAGPTAGASTLVRVAK
jgi:hypothetical protein